MRKKNITHCADTITWYVLYFLPVIMYLLYLLSLPIAGTTASVVVGFENFLNSTGFTLATNNVVFTAVSDLFSSTGILPFFSSTAPIIVVSWFIGMVLLHLAVDFILFIPRLAHKWLGKITE